MFPSKSASRSRWTTLRATIFALVLPAVAMPAAAFGPSPNAALSLEKLSRIDDFLNDQVARGEIPGAIVLIQRHGKPVYFKLFGKRDVDAGIDMTPDAIFPLHSLSKTVTSFAAMMLVDRGTIKLDDPVAKYIPSFAGMKVGVERKDDSGKTVLDLVPLRRPVTIEDLLLHTSGITYGFYGQRSLVKAAYDGIYLGDFDNAGFAERIAKGSAGRAAAHAVGLWAFHRRARPRHRGRFRTVAVPVRKQPAVRSARHDHHQVLPDRSGGAHALCPAVAQGSP